MLSAGKLPFDHAPSDDRQLPDMHMALYNTVIVFDQATKLAYVVTWVHLDRHTSLQEAYQHGQRQLQITSRKIENEHSPNLTNGKVGNFGDHNRQGQSGEAMQPNSASKASLSGHCCALDVTNAKCGWMPAVLSCLSSLAQQPSSTMCKGLPAHLLSSQLPFLCMM